MIKAFAFLSLTMHVGMLGQDSIAIEFARLYNQFRKESGLSTLEYSTELETFAHERLKVSIDGTKECYGFPIWKCPTKDMHFMFIPMALNNNANPEKKMNVITENMAYKGEFTYSRTHIYSKPKKNILTKISAFFTSLIEPEKDITVEYSEKKEDRNLFEYKINSYNSMKEKDIAIYFFQDWLGSEGHKRNFMKKDLTHFAFAYFRSQLNGAPYIQAVWIGGEKKQK